MREAEEVARRLLLEEIERVIADAKTAGETLRIGYHASLLAAAYFAANLPIGSIIDQLVLAATVAGVPVENVHPE